MILNSFFPESTAINIKPDFLLRGERSVVFHTTPKPSECFLE